MSLFSIGLEDTPGINGADDFGPPISALADGSAPTKDIRASLDVMSAAVVRWKVRANAKVWAERFKGVANAILDAKTLVKVKDVFATSKARKAYELAMRKYAQVKDQLAFSSDSVLTLSQQAQSERINLFTPGNPIPLPIPPASSIKKVLIVLGVGALVIGGGYVMLQRKAVRQLGPG